MAAYELTRATTAPFSALPAHLLPCYPQILPPTLENASLHLVSTAAPKQRKGTLAGQFRVHRSVSADQEVSAGEDRPGDF